ncbi:MAG: hypothetical protein V1761_05120 [bacterium]
MFTSANNKIFFKRALTYLFISAFLFVFNLVYGLFAHGVSSAFMTFAFLIPLIGGTVASLALIFLPPANEIVTNLWRMGLATIVVGSLLHGVFDIYGSEVPLVNVFFIVGSLPLAGALTIYIFSAIKAKH